MIKINRLEKDIIWYLFYNGDSSIETLRHIYDFMQKPKPRIATIQKAIDHLSSHSLDLVDQRLSYYDPRKKRYVRYDSIDKHYILTSKGHNYAENMPEIREEYKRKEREYEEDARRY